MRYRRHALAAADRKRGGRARCRRPGRRPTAGHRPRRHHGPVTGSSPPACSPAGGPTSRSPTTGGPRSRRYSGLSGCWHRLYTRAHRPCALRRRVEAELRRCLRTSAHNSCPRLVYTRRRFGQGGIVGEHRRHERVDRGIAQPLPPRGAIRRVEDGSRAFGTSSDIRPGRQNACGRPAVRRLRCACRRQQRDSGNENVPTPRHVSFAGWACVWWRQTASPVRTIRRCRR